MNHVDNSLNDRRNEELRKQQFDRDIRNSPVGMGATAGSSGLSFGGFREPPKSDDEVFKIFKAAWLDAPAAPLFKHETPTERTSDHEVAMTATEQNARVTNLIKVAHANGQNWQPLAESQTSTVAKLHSQVGLGEVGEIDIERGEIRISKAA